MSEPAKVPLTPFVYDSGANASSMRGEEAGGESRKIRLRVQSIVHASKKERRGQKSTAQVSEKEETEKEVVVKDSAKCEAMVSVVDEKNEEKVVS